MKMTPAERAVRRKAIRDARSPEEKAARAEAKKARRQTRKLEAIESQPAPSIDKDGLATFTCPHERCKHSIRATPNSTVTCPGKNHPDKKPRQMIVAV